MKKITKKMVTVAVDSTGAADAAFDGCFLLPKKRKKK